MPEIPIDAMHLQLAMAFGQGAGTMLASEECLTFLLQEEQSLIEQARITWTASRPAFAYLVRLLGQMAAVNAAADGRAEIGVQDVQKCLSAVLAPCPCIAPRRP